MRVNCNRMEQPILKFRKSVIQAISHNPERHRRCIRLYLIHGTNLEKFHPEPNLKIRHQPSFESHNQLDYLQTLTIHNIFKGSYDSILKLHTISNL